MWYVRTQHARPSEVAYELKSLQASSPKGLMVGLVTTNGKSHHEKSHTALVPEDLSTEHGFADITYLKWILVFEKEVREKMYERTDFDAFQATFKSLAERGYHRNPTVGPGLLVTVLEC